MVVAFTPPAVPPVLREAAELKAEELQRTRARLHAKYVELTSEPTTTKDTMLLQTRKIIEQIEELKPLLEHDSHLSYLIRLVQQAQHDPSISQATVLKTKTELLEIIERFLNRLGVSAMHTELLRQFWDKKEPSMSSVTTKLDKAGLDDDFEVVDDRLEAVVESFEKNVAKFKDIDVAAIEQYLESMFASDQSKSILESMRSSMNGYGLRTMQGIEEVDDDLVTWCIEDLLENGLIGDEKRKTLQGYLQSPAAIRELKSTLNVKSARHWNYRDVGHGLPVTARQNSDGEYCIVIEEDIIDMLFLHTTAIGWSMKLKSVLREAISYPIIWGESSTCSVGEIQRMEYWLSAYYKPSSYSEVSPPPPLMPMGLEIIAQNYDRYNSPPHRKGKYRAPPPMTVHSRKRNKGIPLPVPPPPPPPPLGSYIRRDMAVTRHGDYAKSFFLSRLPKLLGASPDRVCASKVQALLLKTLAIEAKLRLALDGSVHGVAASFESFASSLPHQTILKVLEFLGVPQTWLDFFSRYLGAPLNMGPIVRETSDRILTRAQGVPVGHGLGVFFGEAVLFFLDLVVHRETQTHLYRLGDKCYFIGNQQQHDTALTEISRFSKIMGLQATQKDMIAEPLGLVNFTASGQTVSHTIDSSRVKAYASRAKNRLSECSTMIEWIYTWNNTIGNYSPHLFGPLANVFGKDHLESVTHAYNLMHEIILQGQELTSHIFNLFRNYLGDQHHILSASPEALIYFPVAQGGLGIKNPYNTLSSSMILESPNDEFDRFKEAEQNYYNYAKHNFESMNPTEQAEKLTNYFANDERRIRAALGEGTDPAVFPPFDVITADRERAAYPPLPPPQFPSPWSFSSVPDLVSVYMILQKEQQHEMLNSVKISNELQKLGEKLGMKPWPGSSAEDRWVFQMYGEECLKTFGGLAIWHGESVPEEVLRIVRGEESDGSDDGDSYGTMSEA
ncbi:unnamed protein product [Periconia digitata]|uniref:Uncharacterized protein n=1 Tax=Periconia digitata TaxID=1303443 RepID=A0A9W4XGE8_9PLEO|nr:unnamed protein product [Periconia digitata]